MRRFVTTLYYFGLVLIISTITNANISAFSENEYNYNVLQSYEITNLNHCNNLRWVTAYGSSVQACVYEGTNRQVGVYSLGNNRDIIGASFNDDASLVEVYMDGSPISCYSTNCIYLDKIDALIRLENVNGGNWKSLVYYKKFTANLNSTIINGHKVFNYTPKVREVVKSGPNEGAFGVNSKSIAVSNNGRWLVVEYVDVGLVRYDLVSGEYLRFYPDVVDHSWGMMSHSEFAITDDGKRVAHMGLNVDFKVYKIDEDCGDSNINFSLLTRPCTSKKVNTNDIIWSLKYGTNPIFTEGGNLKFVAISTDYGLSPLQVVISENNIHFSSLELLSLGDSFASGEGETDDTYYFPGTNEDFERCHLSKRSYPYLLGQPFIFDSKKVRSVACSGAVMADVVGHSSYNGQRDRLRELIASGRSIEGLKAEAIDSFIPGRIEQARFAQLTQPQKMTVSIGGNDSGLMAKLSSCALPGTCKWASQDRYKAAVGDEINSLYNKLKKTYKNLSEKAPLSDIYAVGYPQIISSNSSCPGVVGIMFNATERTFIRQSISAVNTVINAAAVDSGINYINIEDVFAGHELCEKTITPAVNSVRGGDDIDVLNLGKLLGNESFHPTPFGHQLIANYLMGQISVNEGHCEGLCQIGQLFSPDISDFWGINNSNIRLEYKNLFQSTLDLNKIIEEQTFAPNTEVKIKLEELSTETVVFETFLNSGVNGSLEVPSDYFSIKPYGSGVYSLELEGLNRMGSIQILYDIATVPDKTSDLIVENNSYIIKPDNTPSHKSASNIAMINRVKKDSSAPLSLLSTVGYVYPSIGSYGNSDAINTGGIQGDVYVERSSNAVTGNITSQEEVRGVSVYKPTYTTLLLFTIVLAVILFVCILIVKLKKFT